jgi:hypothetical protein
MTKRIKDLIFQNKDRTHWYKKEVTNMEIKLKHFKELIRALQKELKEINKGIM